ncbi:MAG: class I SAM-dependent methyltransferase [Candidatus Omnitrophota bacterium]|nr:class I SAM-dependent methyltransferase [Candidatus Omnitrophota bacterium]
MIKIIAWVLIAAFIAQDVVWANPEIFESRQTASTVQIPSFFQPLDARMDKQVLEVTLKSILEYAHELLEKGEFTYHLTPTVGKVLLDLEFDKARKEGDTIIVPCGTFSGRSTRLYEAVISSDKSIKLISRSAGRRMEREPSQPQVAREDRAKGNVSIDTPEEYARKLAADMAIVNVFLKNLEFNPLENLSSLSRVLWRWNCEALVDGRFIIPTDLMPSDFDKSLTDNKQYLTNMVNAHDVGSLKELLLQTLKIKCDTKAILQEIYDKAQKIGINRSFSSIAFVHSERPNIYNVSMLSPLPLNINEYLVNLGRPDFMLNHYTAGHEYGELLVNAEDAISSSFELGVFAGAMANPSQLEYFDWEPMTLEGYSTTDLVWLGVTMREFMADFTAKEFVGFCPDFEQIVRSFFEFYVGDHSEEIASGENKFEPMRWIALVEIAGITKDSNMQKTEQVLRAKWGNDFVNKVLADMKKFFNSLRFKSQAHAPASWSNDAEGAPAGFADGVYTKKNDKSILLTPEKITSMQTEAQKIRWDKVTNKDVTTITIDDIEYIARKIKVKGINHRILIEKESFLTDAAYGAILNNALIQAHKEGLTADKVLIFRDADHIISNGSAHLAGDCIQNGLIVIKRGLKERIDELNKILPGSGDILLQVLIEHELRHEATGKGAEAEEEFMKLDAVRFVELCGTLGINMDAMNMAGVLASKKLISFDMYVTIISEAGAALVIADSFIRIFGSSYGANFTPSPYGAHFKVLVSERFDEVLKISRVQNINYLFRNSYKLAMERLGGLVADMRAVRFTSDGMLEECDIEEADGYIQEKLIPLDEEIEKLLSQGKVDEAEKYVNKAIAVYDEILRRGIIDSDLKFLGNFGVDRYGNVKCMDLSLFHDVGSMNDNRCQSAFESKDIYLYAKMQYFAMSCGNQAATDELAKSFYKNESNGGLATRIKLDEVLPKTPQEIAKRAVPMAEWHPKMVPMGVLAMSKDAAALRQAAAELAGMATPEAVKALIDVLTGASFISAAKTAAAQALNSMGIHSETFTAAIASGNSIKTEVTTDGFLEVNVYAGQSDNSNLVRIYTYEPYIKGFEGSNIAFMDSTEHDAVYWWTQENADSGKWQKDYTLINFDFHSDDYGGNIIYPSNWAGHLRQENLIGNYWWVYSNSAFDISSSTDFKTNDVNNLPASDKPVTITIDLDYLIFYLASSLSPITNDYIDNKAKSIIDGLISKGYNIKGINITRSREYTITEWENYAVRKLKEELERLLGTAQTGIRLRSISYAETEDMPLVFKNIGDTTISFSSSDDINLLTLILALEEKNSAIRIAACEALDRLDMSEAAQVLVKHLKTETDPEVIKVADRSSENAPTGTVLNSDKLASIMEYYRPFSEDWRPTTAGLFAPTNFVKFLDLLRKLGVKPGMKLLDAGCGNGIILAMANALGMEAVGYELDKKLFDLCNANLDKLSARGAVDLNSTKVVLGDYCDADLSESNVVYMYWAPARVDGILLNEKEYFAYFKKFEERLIQLKPGARFVILGGPKELLSGLVERKMFTEDAFTYLPFRVFSRTHSKGALNGAEPFLGDSKKIGGAGRSDAMGLGNLKDQELFYAPAAMYAKAHAISSGTDFERYKGTLEALRNKSSIIASAFSGVIGESVVISENFGRTILKHGYVIYVDKVFLDFPIGTDPPDGEAGPPEWLVDVFEGYTRHLACHDSTPDNTQPLLEAYREEVEAVKAELLHYIELEERTPNRLGAIGVELKIHLLARSVDPKKLLVDNFLDEARRIRRDPELYSNGTLTDRSEEDAAAIVTKYYLDYNKSRASLDISLDGSRVYSTADGNFLIIDDAMMGDVNSFLARYLTNHKNIANERAILKTKTNFEEMLKNWNREVLASRNIWIHKAGSGAILSYLTRPSQEDGRVERDMAKRLKDFLLGSLKLANRAKEAVDSAYSALENTGIDKKMNAIMLGINAPNTAAGNVVDIAAGGADLLEAEFDERGIGRTLEINMTEFPLAVMNTAVILREIGRCVFNDDRMDPFSLGAKDSAEGIDIDTHGYFKPFSFDAKDYVNTRNIFGHIIEDVETLAAWFFAFRVKQVLGQEDDGDLEEAMKSYVKGCDEKLQKGVLEIGGACVIVALVEFLSQNVALGDIETTDEYSRIAKSCINGQLTDDYRQFLAKLEMRFLNDFWSDITGASQALKWNAVDSLSLRLGHGEYMGKVDGGYIAHDYKALNFENEEARNRALERLFINPPAAFNMGDGKEMSITGVRREITDNSTVIRLSSSDCHILAIPHPNRPLIIFHILRQKESGEADRARSEIKQEALGEARMLLDNAAAYTVRGLLGSSNIELRKNAAAALSGLGVYGAEKLYAALKSEEAITVAAEMIKALDKIGFDRMPALSFDTNIVINAVNVLHVANVDKAASDAAAKLLGSIQAGIRAEKNSILKSLGSDDQVPSHLAELQTQENFIVSKILPILGPAYSVEQKEAAAYALSLTGNWLAVQLLIDIISNHSTHVSLKNTAALALESIPVVYEGPVSAVEVSIDFFSNLQFTPFGKIKNLSASDKAYMFSGGLIVVLNSESEADKTGLLAHEMSHLLFNSLIVSALSTGSRPSKVIRMSDSEPLGLIDYLALSKEENANAVLSKAEINRLRLKLLRYLDHAYIGMLMSDEKIYSELKQLLGPQPGKDSSAEFGGHDVRIAGELIAIWNQCKKAPPASGSSLYDLYYLVDGVISSHPEISDIIAQTVLNNPIEKGRGLSPNFADHILAARDRVSVAKPFIGEAIDREKEYRKDVENMFGAYFVSSAPAFRALFTSYNDFLKAMNKLLDSHASTKWLRMDAADSLILAMYEKYNALATSPAAKSDDVREEFYNELVRLLKTSSIIREILLFQVLPALKESRMEDLMTYDVSFVYDNTTSHALYFNEDGILCFNLCGYNWESGKLLLSSMRKDIFYHIQARHETETVDSFARIRASGGAKIESRHLRGIALDTTLFRESDKSERLNDLLIKVVSELMSSHLTFNDNIQIVGTKRMLEFTYQRLSRLPAMDAVMEIAAIKAMSEVVSYPKDDINFKNLMNLISPKDMPYFEILKREFKKYIDAIGLREDLRINIVSQEAFDAANPVITGMGRGFRYSRDGVVYIVDKGPIENESRIAEARALHQFYNMLHEHKPEVDSITDLLKKDPLFTSISSLCGKEGVLEQALKLKGSKNPAGRARDILGINKKGERVAEHGIFDDIALERKKEPWKLMMPREIGYKIRAYFASLSPAERLRPQAFMICHTPGRDSIFEICSHESKLNREKRIKYTLRGAIWQDAQGNYILHFMGYDIIDAPCFMKQGGWQPFESDAPVYSQEDLMEVTINKTIVAARIFIEGDLPADTKTNMSYKNADGTVEWEKNRDLIDLSNLTVNKKYLHPGPFNKPDYVPNTVTTILGDDLIGRYTYLKYKQLRGIVLTGEERKFIVSEEAMTSYGPIFTVFPSEIDLAAPEYVGRDYNVHARYSLPDTLLSREEKIFDRQLALGQRHGGILRVFDRNNPIKGPEDANSAKMDLEIRAAIASAKLRMSKKDFKQALQFCEEGLSIRNEYELLALKGICVALLDAYSGNLAMSLCNEAIDMFPKNPFAYCALVQVLGCLSEPSILYYFEDTINRARRNGMSPDGISRIERNIAKFSDKISKIKAKIEEAKAALANSEDRDNPDALTKDNLILSASAAVLDPGATTRSILDSEALTELPEVEPIQFLRNIVDTKELSQNAIEGILSALFSNKKLTLAFSKKLKGLESAQLRALVRELRKWKESTAQKSKGMKALLDNFTILEYDDLKVALNEKKIDANAKDGLIFTYAPKPKDESENTANIGSAVKPVYIIEDGSGFPSNYYYPLLEMVTISLAKELLQWDERELREALSASNITIDTFGIDAAIDEKLGILIFTVLPKIERYDTDSRIDRYTRLLQFLRSA